MFDTKCTVLLASAGPDEAMASDTSIAEVRQSWGTLPVWGGQFASHVKGPAFSCIQYNLTLTMACAVISFVLV